MKTADRIAVVSSAVALLVYLAGAAGIPFYDKGEPREALVVRAILEGRGLALPMREGVEVPSKPPFFHWLAALAVAAGVRPAEVAIRLPSVVGGALGVGLTAAMTARAYGPIAGVAAAVALGTSFEWLRAATQSRVDMTLALAMLLAVLAFRAGLAAADASGGSGGQWLVRAGWLAVTAAVLTKGPVGLVLPLAVIGADALVARSPGRLRRLLDPVGIGFFGVMVAWWLAAALRTGGDAFIARQAIHENIGRVLGGDDAPHGKPFYYYVPALAASFLPWTFAWPATATRFVRARTPADRFFGLWTATVFLVFSAASGKRSVYLLPLYPPLATLTGAGIAALLARPPGRIARIAPLVGAALLALLAAGLALGADGALLALLGRVADGRDRVALPAVGTLIAAERGAIAGTFAILAAAVAALAVDGPRVRLGGLVAAGLVWALALPAFGTRPLAVTSTTAPLATSIRAAVGDAPFCARGYVDYGLRWYLGGGVPACGSALTGHVFVLRAPGAASEGCTVRMEDRRPLAGENRWMLEECGGTG